MSGCYCRDSPASLPFLSKFHQHLLGPILCSTCKEIYIFFFFFWIQISFLLFLPLLKLARGWARRARQDGEWKWQLLGTGWQQHLHRVTVVRPPEKPRAIPLQCKSRRKAGCNAFPTSWLHLSQPPAVTAEGLSVVLQPADLGIKNGV